MSISRILWAHLEIRITFPDPFWKLFSITKGDFSSPSRIHEWSDIYCPFFEPHPVLDITQLLTAFFPCMFLCFLWRIFLKIASCLDKKNPQAWGRASLDDPWGGQVEAGKFGLNWKKAWSPRMMKNQTCHFQFAKTATFCGSGLWLTAIAPAQIFRFLGVCRGNKEMGLCWRTTFPRAREEGMGTGWRQILQKGKTR